jgi:hypothetical protein
MAATLSLGVRPTGRRPDPVRGYVGPQGLAMRYLAGPRVSTGTSWLTGFGVDVLGPDGKPVRPVVGCYGVGLSRAATAIAERSRT